VSGLGVDPWLAKHPQAEIPQPALRAWWPMLHDQLLIQQSTALETVEGLVQRWTPLVAASAAAGRGRSVCHWLHRGAATRAVRWLIAGGRSEGSQWLPAMRCIAS